MKQIIIELEELMTKKGRQELEQKAESEGKSITQLVDDALQQIASHVETEMYAEHKGTVRQEGPTKTRFTV